MESTSFFNERVGFGCHQGPFEKTESAASSLTPYGEQGGVGFGAIQPKRTLEGVREVTQKTFSLTPYGEQGGVGFGAIQLNEVRKGTQKTLSGGPHGNS